MIDLTFDMQFTTLIQTNALPTDCLTFIHDYMHQLRNAHEDEAFPLPSQSYFILETADQLTPIQHDGTAFSCSAGTYYPEYIEHYTFNNEYTLYKIHVMLDNECSMTFFTLQGIHSTETEQWLLANAN
ncbi:hypothetical protein [Paenibacillus sp. UASWS1643]|uniref:hypothetical protein n=1 Tax=Paenibacillus sp. UASWS1643 TaxID=2580422 RepID=UPI00123909DA|nr:hypothetical protein [Paenibacillus sp. UASWS1643]KAA8753965.1 hypothetical protein FE296_12125 [Paenibacillus sp. UASWS1643]